MADVEFDSSAATAKRARREKAAKKVPPGGDGAGALGKRSCGPATPPAAPAARARPASAVVVVVEDTDALDCGVCFLPLKPPIFQCDVGHMVCSACRNKLKANGKCHFCRGGTGGYRRCHGMESLVKSILAPCPNSAYGCTARPAYYDQQDHRQMCPHRPCRCPGEQCGFVGLTEALLDHFSGVHGWPCIAKVIKSGVDYDVHLCDGFNFALAFGAAGSEDTAASSNQCLLLLNVVRQPLGRAISVICIDPHAASSKDGVGALSREIECQLSRFFGSYYGRPGGLINHYQSSRFAVACTDLFNGLPSPDSCFQFVMEDSLVADSDNYAIQVTVCIDII